MREGGRPQVQRGDPSSREGQQGWGGHCLGLDSAAGRGSYRVLIFGQRNTGPAAPRRPGESWGGQKCGEAAGTLQCVSLPKEGRRGVLLQRPPFWGDEGSLVRYIQEFVSGCWLGSPTLKKKGSVSWGTPRQMCCHWPLNTWRAGDEGLLHS